MTVDQAHQQGGDVRAAVAALFDRSSENYDAVGVDFFPVFAKQLLADVGIESGDRVLDAGCGRGAALFAAAERVGDEGSVTGIDLSPRMIELTEQEIDRRGLTNAVAAVMDAQEPALPAASYDVVLAAAVVFFLPDPAAGLRAWHALLAPGGRLGVTCFGANDPRWGRVEEIFRPFVPPSMIWAMLNPSSPFASTENFARAAVEAGFDEVSSTTRTHDVTFRDPEQWVRWSWSHGQRVFWELVPGEHRDEVRRRVLAELDRLREPGGTIVMRQQVRYAVARRAAS
ncbi:class I SAM-dependent methyltransferase [Amycolatopsis minnesotensis]|uniref:class I SAM-dependent methyltransferase n=1 Tax=Amycolatopsis minnesotensis TaxID=337894 RepID=UPI0031D20326